MSSLFRALTLSATLALALSACASIETKGLPKCSGQDRRPLNADLWQQQEAKPDALSQGSAAPMNFVATRAHSTSVAAIDRATVQDGTPRWNITASLQPCQ